MDEMKQDLKADLNELHEKAEEAKALARKFKNQAAQEEARSADFAIRAGRVLEKLKTFGEECDGKIDKESLTQYLYLSQGLNQHEAKILRILGRDLLAGLIWCSYAEKEGIIELLWNCGVDMSEEKKNWDEIRRLKVAVKSVYQMILDQNVS